MNQQVKEYLKDKKILCALWASGSKTDKTTYQRFYLPLKDICKEIVMFCPRDNYFRYGKRKMNRMFLDFISKEMPDIVFMEPMHTEFYPKTFIKAREINPKIRFIGIFSDDARRFDDYSKYYAPFFDVVITYLVKSVMEKYKQLGVNAVFSYGGNNTDFFKPLKIKKEYDVIFIGNGSKEREEMILYLVDSGIKVDVWGKDWEKFSNKINRHGFADPDKINEIINQAKINLNFTFCVDGRSEIKGRTFELGCCKAFVLSGYVEEYRDYYESNELVMFKDKEDMLGKVKYYLQNEKAREDIANNMYQRTINNYSLDKDHENVFSKLMETGEWKMPDIKKIPLKWDYINIRFRLAGLLRAGKFVN